MSIENSIANIVDSLNLGDTGDSIATFIVNFASDVASLYGYIVWGASIIGFLFFVSALFDVKKMKSPNHGNITAGGTIVKVIASALMGTLVSTMQGISVSLLGTNDPMTPLSYIDKAESYQGVSPFTAMIFALMSLVTLIGWFYGIKSLYLFASTNGKSDKQAHIEQAIYMLIGSTILVNLSFAVIGFFMSGGVQIEQYGDF